MGHKLRSYLSPYVHEILVEFSANTDHVKEGEQYVLNRVTDSLLLDWKMVDLLFATNGGSFSDDFNILTQPVDWYRSVLKAMWQLLHRTGDALLQMPCAKRKELFRSCDNLKPNIVDMDKCFERFISNAVNAKLETLLVLTASLERFLGNVCLSKSKNVPFLLRDLLLTDEIVDMFGRTKVTFMQLLIGCPLGLNVRNIAWHGFLTEDDIHPHLVATLFILLASLNHYLTTTSSLRPAVAERDSINLDFHSKILSRTFPNVRLYATVITNEIISNDLIPLSHKCYWQEAYNDFHFGRYANGLVILLPQLEHVLRLMYCQLNGCTERVLTAEATDFYTTLDEILSPKFESHENGILEFIGYDLVGMIEDIFSYPEGPRLRDKMSHWEFCVFDPRNRPAMETFANCISCIALCVVMEAATKKLNLKDECNIEDSKVYGIDRLIPSAKANEQYSRCGLIEELNKLKRLYVPKFHPISYLLRSIECELKSFQSFNCLPKPSGIDANVVNSSLILCECESGVNNLRTKLLLVCSQVFEGVLPIGINNHASELAHFQEIAVLFMKNLKFSTYNRPRNEMIAVTLMRHVIKEIGDLKEKIKDASEIKFKQWMEHKMRSRSRQIYMCMCRILPNLLAVMICIALIIICEIESFSRINDHSIFTHIHRFLKLTLKYLQNVVSYCGLERNQWLEIRKCTSEYADLANQYVETRWN